VGTILRLKKTAVAEKFKEGGERIKKIVFVYVKKKNYLGRCKRKFLLGLRAPVFGGRGRS
jgi:hypothetical protein